MTLANAKSVNRQTLENVVRNEASEFTRRTAIASLASLRMRQNGSCFIGKRGMFQNASEMRQNCVKNASKMRGTPFGRYRLLEDHQIARDNRLLPVPCWCVVAAWYCHPSRHANVIAPCFPGHLYKAGHNKAGRSDFRNQRIEPDTGKMRKMRKVPLALEKQGSEEIPVGENAENADTKS